MIWLSWRQSRLDALIGAGLGAVVVLVVALTGPGLHDLAASEPSVYDALGSSDTTLFYGGIGLLAVAPALVGAFWGAPLIAREVE